MAEKSNYIYLRTSTDMQRQESCDDQHRNVVRDLPRYGLNPERAIVLRDEAASGTKTDREQFEVLCQAIKRGEVGWIAVDDQSRLSRASNVVSLIQDIVFAGARFISTGEGIDTEQTGWELRVQVVGIHNSHTIRELANRVRRGQEGRVLDDGSTGDFPFGYESYYLDADWAAKLGQRGPKPHKGIRILEDEARWVRQVFDWFLAGQSLSSITRKLTELGVSKGHHSSTPGWHPH